MLVCDMEDNRPHFVKREEVFTNEDYKTWVGELKLRLRSLQVKAAIKVNTALLEFYWSLGADIVRLKAQQAWGTGVIEQLSLDLRDAFPNVKGLSYTNLKYASQWYRFYVQVDTNRHQLGGEIQMPEIFGMVPWRHHVEIISKCKDVDEAMFYVKRTVDDGWSRSYLVDMLKRGLHKETGQAITNFDSRLSVSQSLLAKEILKDPYHFDFLGLTEQYTERQLEDALAHNISRFLLELGKGFAFVGRQMELRMPGGQTFFPDMIFYHIKLKCYVVVELKVVEFVPEFAGKLNFYVSAVDHLLKDENDNPSIGLLICKSKDETVVKWSFQDINKPLGVAAYELQGVLENTLSETLPTIEDIERAID